MSSNSKHILNFSTETGEFRFTNKKGYTSLDYEEEEQKKLRVHDIGQNIHSHEDWIKVNLLFSQLLIPVMEWMNKQWPEFFEPYFTTKGVGEGTGLGLTVIHGIVMALLK